MRCLSFFTGKEFYAVDVTLVQQVARKMVVTPVPTAPDAVVGITNLKGRVITLLSLCELFGHKEKPAGEPLGGAVDAVVFKSFSGGDDQIGLVIDRPGNLIDIDDNAIHSGIAEVGNRFYRIISIDSIIERYIYTGEKAANTMLNGGNENDE